MRRPAPSTRGVARDLLKLSVVRILTGLLVGLEKPMLMCCPSRGSILRRRARACMVIWYPQPAGAAGHGERRDVASRPDQQPPPSSSGASQALAQRTVSLSTGSRADLEPVNPGMCAEGFERPVQSRSSNKYSDRSGAVSETSTRTMLPRLAARNAACAETNPQNAALAAARAVDPHRALGATRCGHSKPRRKRAIDLPNQIEYERSASSPLSCATTSYATGSTTRTQTAPSGAATAHPLARRRSRSGPSVPGRDRA
jgi:hypothetical protein